MDYIGPREPFLHILWSDIRPPREETKMSLDWNDLKVFLALERGRSARAAAVSLGTSHSTVLRRLQMLEHALGAQVFDRTPEGLVITGPGETLLRKAQQIEADFLEVEREVAGADVVLKGAVRLTAPPALLKYLMLPILADFRAKYPEIKIEIVSTNRFTDLNKRDADIAIRFSEKPDDYLVGRRLPPFHDAIFCARGTTDPQGMGWIGWTNAVLFQERIATTPLSSAPVDWTIPSLELQAQAAREGLGMALLPCVMGDPDDRLQRVIPNFTQPTLTAWLLQHPDLRRLERVRIFAEFVFAAISKQRGFVAGID